jgi:type I protein arginine methyltransferase
MAEAQNASDERDPTYFSYYAQFVHQQNMLQDSVRTSLYQTAILSNSSQLFAGKSVMDLGAGSGILSYFAVKAGAEKVYAVEASGMADKIQKLMDHVEVSNTWLKGKLIVVKGGLL